MLSLRLGDGLVGVNRGLRSEAKGTGKLGGNERFKSSGRSGDAFARIGDKPGDRRDIRVGDGVAVNGASRDDCERRGGVENAIANLSVCFRGRLHNGSVMSLSQMPTQGNPLVRQVGFPGFACPSVLSCGYPSLLRWKPAGAPV